MTTAEMNRPPGGAFAALSSRSYRIYLLGQSLANTGTWMQSIAQDWLIFDLTHSSTAVGITMALQFLPMLLFGLQAGALADRIPKRRILFTTQTLNAAATATLAVLTIAGVTKAADVYAFALVSGMIFAFDVPARQSFVTEVVPADRLRAAISLTAAVFQATRLIGPAIASLLIVSVGTGWVFAVNAACYIGPTIGLLMLRPADLRPAPPAARARGTVREAVRYVRGRPEVLWTIFLVGMLGTFGLNFPVVLTAMAKSTFGGDASTYGLFNIVLGLGSAAGAVLAGAASRTRTRTIVGAAAVFGILQAAAALAPGIAVFLVLLAAMGFVNLVCQAMANSSVQLAVDPKLRGRVMGLYMLVFIGGTPVGAPIVGAVTGHYGARAGMLLCGAVPLLAATVTAAALYRSQQHGSSARRAADLSRLRQYCVAEMSRIGIRSGTLGVPATGLSVEDARPARVRSRSARHFHVDHGHPSSLTGATRVPVFPVPERSGLDKGQQVGVERVGVRGQHPVREARVRLQRAVLHQLASPGTRSVVGDNLVAVTVHGQDRHADLLQVLAVVLADELRDTLVLTLRAAHHALTPPVRDDRLRRLHARLVEIVERPGRHGPDPDSDDK